MHFDGDSDLQLSRTEFFYPPTQTKQVSVRGKTSGAEAANYGTFQWTNAVQALAILMLRYAAGNSQEQIKLTGDKGSLAASLDEALSKPPNWLMDMFGITADGKLIVKRLIRRSNPQRKRPGPVILSVNEHFLVGKNVQIRFNEKPVRNKRTLSSLATELTSRWRARQPTSLKKKSRPRDNRNFKNSFAKYPFLKEVHDTFLRSQQALGPVPAPFDSSSSREQLKEIFKSEILSVLNQTDIFSLRSVKKTVKNILSRDYFTKLSGGNNQLVCDLDDSLRGSSRLGHGLSEKSLRQKLSRNQSISIAVASGSNVSLAVFYYLKYVKKYNLEINHRFSYAIEIANAILNKAIDPFPDFCVMGIAPAGTLLGRAKLHEYSPVMFLPSVTHRVLATTNPASEKDSSNAYTGGQYVFIQEDPSTSLFYYEDLSRRNMLQSNSRLHLEPYEITAALDSGDPELRAILFSPYHQINASFKNASYVDEFDFELCAKEFVLFAHRRAFADQQLILAFDLAFRDAWLTLMGRGVFLDLVLELLLEDRNFLTGLKRYAGI